MQQGILVDHLSSGHSGSYVQQLVGTIDETLDRERFRSAWQLLSEHHPSLRTCFDIERKQPVQRVVEVFKPAVEFVDWRTVDDESLDQAVNNFLEADRQRGFDISKAPLFRVTVFELSERRYQFVWTSHHLLFDGRSRYCLLKEFYDLYKGGRADRYPDSVGETISYRDFIKRCLENPVEDAKEFWRNAWPLEVDDLSVVEVLRDCSSNRQSGHRTLRRSLDASLTDAIRQASRQTAVGESTLFHSAWALLSNRYTGSRWLVFGVTRSCRHSHTDDLVGLYVNTVPLALNIETGDTISSLLRRVRRCWRALDPYESSSVSDIGKWRNNHHGLFDVILNFESYELNERLRLDGSEWGNRDFQLYGITNLPLVISIYAGPQYELEFVYDSSVLDDSLAASIFEQYATVLSQLTSAGEQPVSNIRLVSEEAFRALTHRVDTNAAKVGQSVNERFQTIVELHHDAIALSQGKRSLTYGELNRDAGRIAATLAGRGVRSGMRIGVLLDRGFDMASSWLGILKVGAIYVPLDPRFPVDRTRFMVHDADIELVISERRYVERAQSLDTETLFIDSVVDTSNSLPNNDLEPDPDAPAYIMYTSGSTGEPKGVVIPHRGIVRLVCDNDYIPFSPKRVFLLHSSVVFDASTLELWGALLNGARCVILDGEGTEISPLGDAIRSQGIDCLWLTSSLFNLIMEERIEILNGVKYLLIGGEALSVPHVTQALDALPDTRIINGYGPTENTTFSCTFPIPRDFNRDHQHVPIGKPIRHTYVYIVDKVGMPVPVGCPGELLIGGMGLALGYLNHDQLTASKFVNDIFCAEQGVRVYRSGDRCRWRDDGQIEFLGRFDDQQKIRGFRVEPSETNAVLNRHPSVAAAATLAVAVDTGDKLLESWVVQSSPDAITDKALKEYIAKQLPYFSVPSRIHIIDKLPLTTSGKIDRNKLLTDRQQLQPSGNAAPRDGLVRMFTSIWEEVLRIKGVEPDSDFFELGGDSLSAMRLLQRIEEKLGIRVSLAEFLDVSTVQSFVASLTSDAPEVPMQYDEESAREEFVL